MPRKRTQEEFIKLSKTKHNNLYTYENVNYINNTTKVSITCKMHNDFLQTPKDHLNGRGCKECGKITSKIRNYKKTKEDFIIQAKILHNNIYTYENVNYINFTKIKVSITCKIHNDFLQTPKNHLNGMGCPECGKIKCITSNKITKKKFLKLANDIHNNTYDYSSVIYKNYNEPIIIICKIHKAFSQKPKNHIHGSGCPKCGKEKTINANTLTQSGFIIKANKVHNNLYSYKKVIYKKSSIEVIITCKKHKDFLKKPVDHLQGVGCPKCRVSKGELAIRNFLDKYNILYIPEKRYTFLSQKIRYDFYIPSKELYIEFDGEQHFRDWHFGKYQIVHQNDLFKTGYIMHKNKTLLRIHFKDLKQINKILKKYIITDLIPNIYYSRIKYYEK